MNQPTDQIYKTLNAAFDFFNKELFSGKLPGCIITMQRRGKSRGYFCAEMFESRNKNTYHVHEIAMNPKHFTGRTDEEIISTLVHEMCHLWQQEYGQPPRRNYHDKEWGTKMEAIGLIPSTTGDAEGAKTGQSMTHYIDPEGKYAQLIKVFFESNEPIHFQDRPVPQKQSKSKNKVKYTCPHCELKAWGKPGISIMCGDDKVELVCQEGGDL